MNIALTFDDGPSVETLALLPVLKKHDVKATFFMIGKNVREHPHIARFVREDGHLIGNHTMTHPRLTDLSADEIREEINDCYKELKSAVGEHSNLFRPPFILTADYVERTVLACGLVMVLFDAAGGDGTQNPPDFIVQKVMKELDGKSGIVLLHDGCPEGPASRADTIVAVDRLIPMLKELGAEFVFPEVS
jgi:peptidoglycan/xylan/chitin deacetylase (PgdA/CDA1 family)